MEFESKTECDTKTITWNVDSNALFYCESSKRNYIELSNINVGNYNFCIKMV